MENEIQKTIQKIRNEASHVTDLRILELHDRYGKTSERSINNGHVNLVDTGSEAIDKRSDEGENRETHNLRLQIIANENREDDEQGIIIKVQQLKTQLGYSSAATLGAVEEHILYGKSAILQHWWEDSQLTMQTARHKSHRRTRYKAQRKVSRRAPPKSRRIPPKMMIWTRI